MGFQDNAHDAIEEMAQAFAESNSIIYSATNKLSSIIDTLAGDDCFPGWLMEELDELMDILCEANDEQ